jgi:hypothetical protein
MNKNTMNDSDVGFAISSLIMNLIAGKIHTAMIGRVESYNKDKRTGDVKPMVRRAGIDGMQTEYAVLPDVPFFVYSTAGAGIVLPVAAGDFVLLIFNERRIDGVMSSGNISNSTQNRLFDLSDAIAFPGVFPKSVSIPSTGANDITIINNGGKVVVNASGDIELGPGALTKLANELFTTAHVHTSAAPGSPTSKPIAAIPPLSYVTSKVRAQ